MVQTLWSRLVLLNANGVDEYPLPLDRDRLVLGRSKDCDVVLADPQVSRHHAELRDDHGLWVLRDLGSTAGTTRGGHRLDRPVALHHGDVIGLGPVHLRFEEDSAEPPTLVRPKVPPPRASVPPDSGGRMDFGPVDGDDNNFVIGTQNNYQQRDSFLRQVAATRTRARVFIWLGVVLLVTGIATALVVFSGFFSDLSNAVSSPGIPPPPQDPFGAQVGGVPLLVIAAAVEITGLLMIVIGIVLHVVATARRKDLDRKFPVHRMHR